MNDGGTMDPSHAARAGARQSVRYTVDGLEDAAEIRVDRWGVPHIKAGSRSDALAASLRPLIAPVSAA